MQSTCMALRATLKRVAATPSSRISQQQCCAAVSGSYKTGANDGEVITLMLLVSLLQCRYMYLGMLWIAWWDCFS